jgi:hypothetical protein
MTKEELAASPTGVRFNNNKLKWGLVDYKAIEPLVEVLMFGAEKYDAHNWKKGLDKTEILESMQRHLVQLMSGELDDQESGLPHIGHIMCNAMFFSHFILKDKQDEKDVIRMLNAQ